jgi:1-aminocyclopropane-1-carboxylate deaminase/D-cysteine desulfhydrase-like pyridoxal-dependent ACC family enzyme
MPTGACTEEMQDMLGHGAVLVQHKAGYNSVVVARAKEDAGNRPGWCYIPFGMESDLAVKCTAHQVQGIPKDVQRIVVPIGSGVSACGIMHGLCNAGLGEKIHVVGIRVGADPTKRLNRFGPVWWHRYMEVVDVSKKIPYDKEIHAVIGGKLLLDPIYEAKCVPYLQPGDLLWVVGIRNTKATQGNL